MVFCAGFPDSGHRVGCRYLPPCGWVRPLTSFGKCLPGRNDVIFELVFRCCCFTFQSSLAVCQSNQHVPDRECFIYLDPGWEWYRAKLLVDTHVRKREAFVVGCWDLGFFVAKAWKSMFVDPEGEKEKLLRNLVYIPDKSFRRGIGTHRQPMRGPCLFCCFFYYF